MKPKPLEALNHFTVPCSFTSHPGVRDSGRSRRYFELFAFLALRLGNYSTASQASQIAFRTKKKGRKDCPCMSLQPLDQVKRYHKSKKCYQKSTTKCSVCPQ